MRVVEVVDYDERWPERFEAERRLLASILPPGASIEHIGSTSVPGLAAKPIIDIMVVVPRAPDVAADVPSIERLGYVFRPGAFPEDGDHLFFVKDVAGMRTHHLHVFDARSPKPRANRVFREFLAGHPEAAARYAAVKRAEDGGSRTGWECVFLARHGQTEWNLHRRRQGQLDSALTDRGVEQARRHAAVLRPHMIDAIFASPLGRATATAEIIGGHLGLSVTVIDELTEVHHGQIAGLTDEDIQVRYPDHWSRRASDKYGWTFPGGESYADADVRAGHALTRISGYLATRPLIVSHEMIGRMLQRHLLGLDPQQALAVPHPNGVVYRIDPVARVRHTLGGRGACCGHGP